MIPNTWFQCSSILLSDPNCNQTFHRWLIFSTENTPKEESQSSSYCTELWLPPFGSKLLMFFAIISRWEAFQHRSDTNKFHTFFFVCVFFSPYQNPSCFINHLRYLRLWFSKATRFLVIRHGFVFVRGRTSRRNSKVLSPLGMTQKGGFNECFTLILPRFPMEAFFWWSNVWLQQIVLYSLCGNMMSGTKIFSWAVPPPSRHRWRRKGPKKLFYRIWRKSWLLIRLWFYPSVWLWLFKNFNQNAPMFW